MSVAERIERLEQRQALPPSRAAEQVIAIISMSATTVLLGGFTLVMNSLDEVSFAGSGLPELLGLGADADPAEAYHLASTLAAWFGFTLITVLLLAAVGLLMLRRRPSRRTAGWWFLGAGLVCLVGSQLILYPVAFGFFLTAGLLALRPVGLVEPDEISRSTS